MSWSTCRNIIFHSGHLVQTCRNNWSTLVRRARMESARNFSLSREMKWRVKDNLLVASLVFKAVISKSPGRKKSSAFSSWEMVNSSKNCALGKMCSTYTRVPRVITDKGRANKCKHVEWLQPPLNYVWRSKTTNRHYKVSLCPELLTK